MKLKEKIQESLVKYAGAWQFKKYVEKNRLEDNIVNSLIREHRDEYLLFYMKQHSLSTSQISEILMRDKVDEVMLAAVRAYTLTNRQQETLVEKNNALLLEAYLSPKGFFETSRRFSTLAEYKFIYGMVKSQKLTGAEIFKTYVDNFYRTLLTDDLVKLLIENENTYPAKYILHRAKLKREWEEMFVNTASEDMIKDYINDHDFGLDASQMALIEKHFPLARIYYDKYKFRPVPQQLYHERRQEEAGRKKSETET